MAEIGETVRFHYPNFGTPEGYPELRAHSGQMVTVVEEVWDNETDERLFKVIALDGGEFQAFESELGDVPDFRPHDPVFCGCKER